MFAVREIEGFVFGQILLISLFISIFCQSCDGGYGTGYTDSENNSEQEMPESIENNYNERTPVSYSKPDINKIQKDLVGHEIAEGVDKEDAWFADDWRWKIKKGQISNFKIEEVLKDNSTEYQVVASMLLTGEFISFTAEVRISYMFSQSEGWKIEFVNSQGMEIVRTHKYDDCVSYSIEDDGWGGVNALYITNKIEIELAVGGYIYSYGEWHKFAVKVGPKETKQVGGTLGGGSVSSYKIEMVERI